MLSSSSAGWQMIPVGGGHWEDRDNCEEDIAAEMQRDEMRDGRDDWIGIAVLGQAPISFTSS